MQARYAAHATTYVEAADNGMPAFVMPVGLGDQSGSSWANAAPATSLPNLVKTIGDIWLRADVGAYPPMASPLGLGAQPGAWIHGVDANGQPAKAIFIGSRDEPYRAGGAPGGEVFRLGPGADHLHFTDMSFHNVQTPFRVWADVADLTLACVVATNVRHLLTTYASGLSKTAAVRGLNIGHVDITGFSKSAIGLSYDTCGVVISDVVGDSQNQDGDNFAMGLHLDGTCHDVQVVRTRMNNCLDTVDAYWNGDGFCTERGVYDVSFDTCSASGNADSGFDLKSATTTLANTTADGNKRNYRFWATDTTVNGGAGTNPYRRGGTGSAAQVWVAQGGAVTLNGLALADVSPLSVVFDLCDGARADFAGSVERDPASALLVAGNGSTLAVHSSI